MASVREPAGTGFKIITILAILFFLALVAGLITTYDTDSEVAAVAPPAAAASAAAQAPAPAQAPVGAVATGGGGMAGEGVGMAVPIVVGLVVLTMMAATRIVLRRQGRVTPV